MMILKLCNNGKSVVGTDDDGNMVSYLISAEEYKQWLVEGNTPIPEFTEDEIKEKLKSDAIIEYERIKIDTLSALTVKVSTGKVFYADSESRVDIESAIRNAESKGISYTKWKLAEEFNGNKITIVTLEELKEASYLALNTKATLVGIV